MTALGIAANIAGCALIVGVWAAFAILMVVPHQNAKRARYRERADD